MTTIVALSYRLFLGGWALWEDQSIYQYMAWGVRHGRVLYRDVINMNWPGCVLVHLLGQAISGMNPSGVRLVEAGFLWLLGIATCAILRAYRVGVVFRIAAVTLFLASYFEGGFAQTAQRETFMTPCLAVGLLPLMTATTRAPRGHGLWGAAGAAAAFGLAVKPTLALPLAGAALLLVACWEGARAPLWTRLGAYAAGGVAVLASVLAFLLACGDLRGFWEWAVRLTFGPYARIQWDPEQRVRHFVEILKRPDTRPLLYFCAAGVAAYALLALARAVRTRAGGHRARAGGGAIARRTAQASLLVCTAAASIYVQGKTHCVYHFIPLEWALAIFGATLCGHVASSPRLARLGRSRGRFPAAAASLLALVGGIAYYGARAQVFAHADAGAQRDDLADRVAGQLRPDETAVLFGIDTPSFLCTLQRPTPLPFVDSWIMFASTPRESQFRSDYLRAWNAALLSPDVRFFIVQRASYLPPGLRLEKNDPAFAPSIVAKYFPEEKLAALGFHPSETVSQTGFDIYERAR